MILVGITCKSLWIKESAKVIMGYIVCRYADRKPVVTRLYGVCERI